jgi:anti-anti-sigma factor
MDIEASQHDNITIVRLTGRLDSPGVDRIETRFTAAVAGPGRPAAVDLSGVSFLASMGIRMLISNARALRQKGAKMALFGVPEPIMTVLDHVAIDQIIPVLATEQDAAAALAA